MSTLNKQHLALRLRAAFGYSDRDARRTVRDFLVVLRDLLEDLDTDESLGLEHIGKFESQAKACLSGKSHHHLRFKPSIPMATLFYQRPLPDDDPRVIAAKERRAMLDALPRPPWWRKPAQREA
ncbi:MAG: hypothetical protein Q8O14_07645 [bacterium]|nr:hypothetical protein [bacterium]